MQSMSSTPKTRKEFERNIYLLVESVENGRMNLSHDKTINDIVKVRKLPNGRIDFLTVEESTRLMANTAADFDNMSNSTVFQ